MPFARRRRVLLALLALAACSPTLDWREVSPEGDALVALFPCRPDRHERRIALAAGPATMQMLVCAAGDATYALSVVDVAEPDCVAVTLSQLRAVAAANVGASAPAVMPLQLAGATANAQAGRVLLLGRLPDGAGVQVHAAFFTRGLRVYQASLIGAKPTAVAVDTFFSGLKFASPRP